MLPLMLNSLLCLRTKEGLHGHIWKQFRNWLAESVEGFFSQALLADHGQDIL